MSSGPPLQHLHQTQHGLPATSQPFYHPREGGAGLHDNSTPIMDASQFGDFAFPFSGLPGQNHMMAMPDHSHVGFDDHSAHYSQHHAMAAASLPPNSHTMASMASMPAPAFQADSENHRSSPSTSDDGARDRNSPLANSLEDPAADEFGLHGRGRADGTDLGGKTKDDRGGGTPAWSELKTKAGKDRKRLPLACIACRRKKIRCSGEKPACKHCLRSRIPCVYKVTTRKAAPRTDYMAMLDKRLKRMEERIIKIIPRTEQDGTPTITRAVVRPAIPGTAPANKSASKKRCADDAFGPDLEAWAKAPCKSRVPEGDDKPTGIEAREEEENKLFREGIVALPPKDIQEHLAEVFFDNVYGQAYHLLHKPSYMRKLKNNALPPVLVLSVCAVAARFTPNPKISPTARQFLRGEEWASHARDICTRRYEWPNITILTCLLILGLHEFGTCHGGRSWALGGQAIRMAFALQLHKDLEYDPLCRSGKTPLSFIDREIRRRIMWACFLMDRFNSSGSDRPMFIKEESIKIQLPVREKCFQLDMPAQTVSLDGSIPRSESPDEKQMIQARANMGVAAYTIRSVAIWGRIVTYLNQGGKEMDSQPMWSAESDYAKLVEDIDKFARTLPSAFQYSLENLELQITEKTASQFLLLHLSAQQNTLFLSQAAVAFANSRARLEAPKDFVSRVSARAFAAANRISEILRDSEQSQCCISAPFAGYCAFSSTTMHIMGIFSGNPAVKATAETNSGVNIKFLRKLMRFWGMFHWMVENIRTQYRNAMDASRSGKVGGDGSATSPIIQYADWFDRYPHGVSDSDMADPPLHRKRERGEDAVLEQKPELQSVEEFFTTLSPQQSADGRDAQRNGSLKRKQSIRKQGDMPTTNGESQKPESASKSMSGRPGTGQGGAQHQPPRRFSSSLGGQTSGPTVFSPLAVPQSEPQPYTSMSPMSPVQVNQFSQQQQQQPPPAQNPFFSADILSMNMPPQPNSISQPLDRQITFNGFSMDSAGGINGGPNTMDGNINNGWAGIPVKAEGQRNIKIEGGMATGRHHQGQSQMAPDGMNGFSGADPAGWFMPFNMDGTDGVQNMGLGGHNVDPFTNMFGGGGGMMTPTQLDALGHSL
ncbi:putative transcriptional regulatory protein [Tolypocladium ophioglossoides CBS 100239]|uniref:Putative transcriptional regulatory protein n=1 Tax=Tolypocladium ophioglossoides (strain CBS 100239) TaxID=1163406 RepID=A0A0L0NDM5_TOLOC|nr:putative transcriptional regulatory protein [Tolypocladium ophioglossoides CBS 100239]